MEEPPGHVLGRRVDHRLHVGERNAVQERGGIVGVERRPAAVAALHAERPVEPGGDGTLARRRLCDRQRVEHRQDDRRVVDVGIPVVGELERPAARLERRVQHRPVARPEDLVGDEPVPGAAERRVRGVEADVEQRLRGQRGVPVGRHARLVHERALAFDEEVLHPLDAAHHGRMIGGEADGVEREHGIHHRRLDAAPLSVAVLVAQDPLDGARDGATADRPPAYRAEGLERAVDGEEEVPRRHELGRAREGHVVTRRRPHPELRHRRLRRYADRRPVRREQRQRHHRAARPARHRVDVEREPRRQQHELDRHRRHTGPRKLVEVCEPHAREDTGAREPALAEDEVARAGECGLAGVHLHELQGEVGLDRRRQAARSTMINRPAAVGLLEREQALGEAPLDVGPCAPEEAVEEDVLGLHRHVGLERRVPVPAGVLRGEEVLACARDRVVDPLSEPFRAHPSRRDCRVRRRNRVARSPQMRMPFREHDEVGRERDERAVEDRHPCLPMIKKARQARSMWPSQARSLTSEAARRICQMAF